MLWAIWAAKEAAYKAVSKSHAAVPSTPKRYRVAFLDALHPASSCAPVTEARPSAAPAIARETPAIPRGHRDDSPVHPLAIARRLLADAAIPENNPKIHGDATILRGVVTTPVGEVSFETLIGLRYVHCLAVMGPQPPVGEVISEVLAPSDAADLSASLRRAAIGRLASILGTDPSTIEIRRARTPLGYGPPHVFVEGQSTDIDITLSHDGAFGAFVFCRR